MPLSGISSSCTRAPGNSSLGEVSKAASHTASCHPLGSIVRVVVGRKWHDGDVAGIINSSCALTGCHVTGGGTPGEFETYEGLSDYTNDGPNGLRDRVIVLQNDPNIGMPPNNSNGPQDLTELQLEIFKCWADSGYPEN